MIARIWHGTSDIERADRYIEHLRTRTLPQLATLDGQRGVCVLRRAESPTGVAVIVVTLWDSVEAIGRFAGSDVEAAVVPAEAQALLTSWDERASHWDVALLQGYTAG
jgi:heme-degrading monooxygenase HmoA